MNMTENARAYRARNLRYKRAALASMGFEIIRNELEEMRDSMDAIHWWSDQDEETLLNALDGDEDDAWEFKMAFSDLEAKADRLFETIYVPIVQTASLRRYQEMLLEDAKERFPGAVSVEILINAQEVTIKPTYAGELNGISMQTIDGGWCTKRYRADET